MSVEMNSASRSNRANNEPQINQSSKSESPGNFSPSKSFVNGSRDEVRVEQSRVKPLSGFKQFMSGIAGTLAVLGTVSLIAGLILGSGGAALVVAGGVLGVGLAILAINLATADKGQKKEVLISFVWGPLLVAAMMLPSS